MNSPARDCEAVVTMWADAPISWPRGHALTEKQGDGPGIVEEVFAYDDRRST